MSPIIEVVTAWQFGFPEDCFSVEEPVSRCRKPEPQSVAAGNPNRSPSLQETRTAVRRWWKLEPQSVAAGDLHSEFDQTKPEMVGAD